MAHANPGSTPTSTGHSLAPPPDPPEDRRLKAAGPAEVARPSRGVAATLAVLVGWTGAHWFYLGRPRRGVLYLGLTPVLLASLFLALVDALRFFWLSRAEFDRLCIGPVPPRLAQRRTPSRIRQDR